MFPKKNINKVFFLFLSIHLVIWTLIPSISNINLPLDTIEALAWGSNLSWGFNKHPPFSAFSVELFYQIFGNQDWAYYLLSQIFVVFSFLIVFKFADDFFNNKKLAFVSVLLLEGIFFYNYTTPEFNVNISQLPFWILSIFFTWRCIKNSRVLDHLYLGLVIGLGILSKYLFLYLVAGIILLFIYLKIYKKNKLKVANCIITFIVALTIISPHLFWLLENNFITINYGLQRTGVKENIYEHIILPLTFVFKQLLIFAPFFLMIFFLTNRFYKIKIEKSEKSIFLFFIFLIPIILIILTSFILGAKIRTMWMTPFYLISGVCFLELLKKWVNFKNMKKFSFLFLFLFILSPILYLFVSLSNDFKRTDYPGKEIARLVQNKWDDNFRNEIMVVVGDEWFAGNLSYHLESRPKWMLYLKENAINLKTNEGVIYTGNPKILKKICPGVYGAIKPVGYCMIGTR